MGKALAMSAGLKSIYADRSITDAQWESLGLVRWVNKTFFFFFFHISLLITEAQIIL